MFGKRLRKEEPADAAATCRREASAVAAAAGSLLLATPSCSIELATPSSSISALPRTLSSSGTPLDVGVVGLPPRPVERGTVRSKAAYFEALCRANTTLHIECSAEGARHSCHPPIQDVDNDAAEDCPAGAVFACDTDMAAADSDADEAGSWQDYSEVHLLLRMPRGPGPSLPGSGSGSGSSKYGSVAEMEALVEQLQQALVVKEAQRKAAVDAFRRRSNEADNLQRVVRELSEGRAKVAVQRAMLADKYADLQQEYHRMLRIADLSRTVSKEHVASTSRTRSELRRVQSELHATKSHAQSLSEKQKKVRVELLLLKEKVQLLERFDFEEMQESVCKRQFTRYRVAETY